MKVENFFQDHQKHGKHFAFEMILVWDSLGACSAAQGVLLPMLKTFVYRLLWGTEAQILANKSRKSMPLTVIFAATW